MMAEGSCFYLKLLVTRNLAPVCKFKHCRAPFASPRKGPEQRCPLCHDPGGGRDDSARRGYPSDPPGEVSLLPPWLPLCFPSPEKAPAGRVDGWGVLSYLFLTSAFPAACWLHWSLSRCPSCSLSQEQLISTGGVWEACDRVSCLPHGKWRERIQGQKAAGRELPLLWPENVPRLIWSFGGAALATTQKVPSPGVLSAQTTWQRSRWPFLPAWNLSRMHWRRWSRWGEECPRGQGAQCLSLEE